MVKSKKTVEFYNPDWDAFRKDQQTATEISEDDWKKIFALRNFRPGTELIVKTKIEQALHSFMRLNTAYNNVQEYRQKIKSLLDEVSRASRSAYELEKYNYQRFLMISPVFDIDPGFAHAVLNKEHLEAFYLAGHKIQTTLGETLEALGEQFSGPQNDDVYWLVRVLNHIAIEFSDYGRLTRSNIDRPDIGNDVQFVECVLEIAKRETGRTFGPGTVINAIRKLH